VADESTNTIAQINRAMNQYNLLQVRLDTSDILNQIKMFLNAEIEIVEKDPTTGQYKRSIIPLGKPYANRKGISRLMNWMQMTINAQVVQGNFPMDIKGSSTKYDQFIYEFHTNLAHMLMLNLYNYGIDDEEYPMIIDSINNLVVPFMTRLIGNKERESYGETFKEISSTSIRDRGKMPSLTG